MKAAAEAVGIPYPVIYQRFLYRDSFYIKGIFFTRLDPEDQEEAKRKAEALEWKPNRITTERRLINAKPAPLLGFGHITHGINDRFGK